MNYVDKVEKEHQAFMKAHDIIEGFRVAVQRDEKSSKTLKDLSSAIGLILHRKDVSINILSAQVRALEKELYKETERVCGHDVQAIWNTGFHEGWDKCATTFWSKIKKITWDLKDNPNKE